MICTSSSTWPNHRVCQHLNRKVFCLHNPVMICTTSSTWAADYHMAHDKATRVCHPSRSCPKLKEANPQSSSTLKRCSCFVNSSLHSLSISVVHAVQGNHWPPLLGLRCSGLHVFLPEPVPVAKPENSLHLDAITCQNRWFINFKMLPHAGHLKTHITSTCTMNKTAGLVLSNSLP